MSPLQAVILILLTPYTSAVDYCSISDTTIKCVPCSNICREHTKCESIFRCPKKCSFSSPSMCKRVCGWECQNEACEYAEDGGLICSEGCLDGLTGKLCKERCPKYCRICQQYSPECNTCKDGFKGENCSDKERRDDTTSGCLTADCVFSVSAPPAAVSSGKLNLAVLIVAIVAALAFTVIVVLTAYMLKRRQMHLKSDGIEEKDAKKKSEHDIGGYRSYDNVDDVSAGTYYAGLHTDETRKPNLQ